MKSKLAPVIPIDLGDGKERSILFDYEALARIEEALDQPIFGKGFIDILVRAKNAPAIIWGAVGKSDPDLTIEKVKELLAGKDPSPVMDAIMKAWGLSMPKPQEVEEAEKSEDPTNPETNLDGSISGQ